MYQIERGFYRSFFLWDGYSGVTISKVGFGGMVGDIVYRRSAMINPGVKRSQYESHNFTIISVLGNLVTLNHVKFISVKVSGRTVKPSWRRNANHVSPRRFGGILIDTVISIRITSPTF